MIWMRKILIAISIIAIMAFALFAVMQRNGAQSIRGPNSPLDHTKPVGGGYTELHISAEKGDVSKVKALLDSRADPNIKDDAGRTPLHYVVSSDPKESHLEIMELLLQRGADPNLSDKHNVGPLHLAAALRKVELLKMLIAHGADVNRVGSFGLTPLHEVCNNPIHKSQDVEIVKILLNSGAKIELKSSDGETALDIAKRNKKLSVIELLNGR
jgi:ankyrin repeat protein